MRTPEVDGFALLTPRRVDVGLWLAREYNDADEHWGPFWDGGPALGVTSPMTESEERVRHSALSEHAGWLVWGGEAGLIRGTPADLRSYREVWLPTWLAALALYIPFAILIATRLGRDRRATAHAIQPNPAVA